MRLARAGQGQAPSQVLGALRGRQQVQQAAALGHVQGLVRQAADDQPHLLALARAGFAGDLALRAVALRRSLLASRYKGMTAAARVAAQRFVEEAERALDAGPARGAL